MTQFQRMATISLLGIEKAEGLPTFTWNGGSYNFVPSVEEFKRQLDTGSFAIVKLLTASVRKLTKTGESVFTTLPMPQQTFTYNGHTFRIESIKTDPTNSYFVLTAVYQYRGV